MKNNKNKVIVVTLTVILLVLVIGILYYVLNSSNGESVEVMDLYGDIAPYGDMSYGDRYVANEVFEPLIQVTDDFKIKCVLAKNYTIDGNKITVNISNKDFLVPDSNIKMDSKYIEEYMNNLIRLRDSDLISNPGLANISDFSVDGNKLTVIFNSEKPENILALTENIGYQKDGKWYGTKNSIEYNTNGSNDIKVGKTTYKTSATTPGIDSDKRITNMVLGNVLTSDGMKTKLIPNGSYGFITWGPSGIEKFTKEVREVIFDALENSDIRNPITIKSKSIYDGTSLFEESSINQNATAKALKDMGVTVNKSLNIGIIDMGSFSEIDTAITNSLRELEIPVVIDKVELNDLISNDNYDLIYVRLQRGKSPDFTGLFSSTGILGRLDYLEDYSEMIEAVDEAKTWDEMCARLSVLDKALRDGGVWKFLDQGYDVMAFPNK